MAAVNARRSTWILFGVVILLCLGLSEVMLRVAIPRRILLDIAEDAFWMGGIRHGTVIVDEGMNVRHDPKLGWKMRPHFVDEGVHINSAGMRGQREYTRERQPGMKRVVLIGDSYTFGLGVRDDETFAAILEDSRDDLEVLNCGANGWGTDQSVIDYVDNRKAYDPDAIVVGIYEDDFNRNGVIAREYLKPRFVVQNDELILTNVPIPAPDDLDVSTLPRFDRLRIVDAALFGYRTLRWKTVRKHQLDGPFEEKAAILRLLLRDLKKQANEGGRKRHVVVLTWPTMWFDKGRDTERIRDRVMAIAAELEIPAYDLYDALRAREAREGKPIYGEVTAHWTPAGHEVAAAQLKAHFEKIGL